MAVRRISNLENIPENQETSVKRVPPPLIQKVLDYDAQLTQDFSKFLEQNLPVTITKSKTKFLEVMFTFFILSWLQLSNSNSIIPSRFLAVFLFGFLSVF